MADFYQSLGVRKLINAAGNLTRLGGPPLADEVIEAMREAAQWSVRIEELQEKAGAYLAEVTGAESGYVTCGAAAGLQLAAAACMAGLDIRRIDRLPDTPDIPNEIIIQRCQRNGYDRCLRAAGAKLIEVGNIGHPRAGYTDAWHIEGAIHDRTVAVHWVYMDGPDAISLEKTVAVAHRHGLSVIVDAAAALPPAPNLRRFVAEGADLVTFSGGKDIRGPQASGILVGRQKLIDSVALQHQDMDVLPRTWTLRHRYLDTGILPGPPLPGLGRPLKVGKEEIAGLVAALGIYVAQDHAVVRREQVQRLTHLQEGLANLPGVTGELVGLEGERVPLLRVHLDERVHGWNAFDLINRLLDDDPAIALGQEGARHGYITINPVNLKNEQIGLVGERLRALLDR